MGGCCSKGVEQNTTPAYYYYPGAVVGDPDVVPIPSNHGSAPGFPTGLLVDTNLDTSVPDAYRPPPAPLPFDVRSSRPPQSGSDSGLAAILSMSEDLKILDGKQLSNLVTEPSKELEVELSKSTEAIISAIEEEDVCPTCLEEYDTENPKITTKCEHHFHLACILEWKERSDTCPVCDKEMIFNTLSDNLPEVQLAARN